MPLDLARPQLVAGKSQVIDPTKLSKDDWLTCNAPLMMLEFLEGKRGIKLAHSLEAFALACCLRLSKQIPPRRRHALTAIRRWFHKRTSLKELEQALTAALRGWEPRTERRGVIRELIAHALWAFIEQKDRPLGLARSVVVNAQQVAWHLRGGGIDDGESKVQAALMRKLVKYPVPKSKSH